jgi:hypothetical protein
MVFGLRRHLPPVEEEIAQQQSGHCIGYHHSDGYSDIGDKGTGRESRAPWSFARSYTKYVSDGLARECQDTSYHTSLLNWIR